jgi:hypothetical protein
MAPLAVLGRTERRASDSIPDSAPAFAASPDSRALEKWYDRVFLGSYRRLGRRNPKWDADAEAFIRSIEAEILHGLGGAPVSDLVARGRRLLAAGCDDPLILSLAARAEAEADGESRQSSELLERAVAGMHDVAYPRVLAFRAAADLRSDFARRDEGMGKREALAPVELRWFIESLDDGSYAADEDVVLVRQLAKAESTSFFTRNRAAIVPAVESRKWIDPWVRLYLRGQQALDDAWDARGSRWANRVTREGWKGFEESLEAARKALTASWQARKDRPEAAAAMIVVAKADATSHESPRVWFDRAVSARFDWEPAYRALIDALRERWAGDPEALPGFARACAATRRFDTVVPFMAFVAVEQMEFDRLDAVRPRDEETDMPLPFPASRRPPSVYRDQELYDMVAAVLERYRREPAAQSDWKRYASLQAAIAYKAGRYEDARRFLHDCGGVLAPEAGRAVDEPLLEARIEAQAAPDGEATRRAETLYLAGRPAEAAPVFEQALAHAVPAARPYLAQRLAAATLETRLAAGEKVRWLPPAGLDGWTPVLGTWIVDKDGSLLGTSGMRGLLINADARVGPDFQIEADVEIASTSNGQFQAGIVFGEAPSFWSHNWSSFRWKRTAHEGEVAYFSRHFNAPVHLVKRKVLLRNRVLIQSWNGRLSAWLNAEPVVTEYLPEWNPPRGADNQVGFGAYLDDNTFSVRYRDVWLRRLTAAPSRPTEGDLP